MKPVYLAVVGTLALAAVGCVGEFSTNGPPQDINDNPNNDLPPAGGADAGTQPEPTGDDATAKVLFDSNVAPIVTQNCANGGCHLTQAPVFGSADPTTAYDTAILQRDSLFAGYIAENSRLIVNGTNGHQGSPIFTQDDIDGISAWLAQEKLDADAAGGVAVSAMAQWSGCMDFAQWEASNVADEWADKGTNQGNCDACHNLGADRFFASNQDQRVFDAVTGKITNSALFMPSYFTLDALGTSVVINRARLEKVGNQIAPNTAHAAFNVDGDAMEALQLFYDQTKLKVDAANNGGPPCGPPVF